MQTPRFAGSHRLVWHQMAMLTLLMALKTMAGVEGIHVKNESLISS